MLRFISGLAVLCMFILQAAAAPLVSDVPGLTTQQLHSQYWLSGQQHDEVLLSAQQISERNRNTFAVQSELQPLQNLPLSISGEALKTIINSVSAIPASARFYADGTKLDASDWQRYRQLLALEAVKPDNPLQFALVVRRTAMRAFPTLDRVFNEQMNTDLDRFSETALFVAEPVAVLHQNKRLGWALVQSYHYTGWVQLADIATGNREQILQYSQKEPFIVTTGARVTTAYNPEVPAISELALDMGIRLPLLSSATTGNKVYGQNPVASYIVQLPHRLDDGSLSLIPALIPRSADVSEGYLAFTERALLTQAFKFLGERYGWGHDYNGRDCTGFISEVFRSFGLLMPRNSGQQGKGHFGTNIRFDASSSEQDKRQALASLKIGDLLYFPGHVSMYLGQVDGVPYMIHDVNTLIYPTEQGMYHGTLNGVAVTPLMPLFANAQQSYLQALYTIKSLR